MRYAISFVVFALIAAAGPVVWYVGILNYALTLEHLEDKFYREGLANYTQADYIKAAFADPFYDNLKEISCDETTHVSFLNTAFGNEAVAECTYSFPSTEPSSFIALASVLEGVGVSVSLGAAVSIANKDHLTDSGFILTVEARHGSYFRAPLTVSPFPHPFVYTLAASFIVSCPVSNADKPQLLLKAFPWLALGTVGPIKSGDTINLLTPGHILLPKDGMTPIYAAFITVTGPIYADVTSVQGGFKVVIPTGINEQSYVVLMACKDKVNDETVASGPAITDITNWKSHSGITSRNGDVLRIFGERMGLKCERT